MSEYTELYKKYRPKKWSDFVGQEQIIDSIKNAIKNNTIPTAYLFYGTHGSGKTSAAFMLAASLNAEELDDNQNPIQSKLVDDILNDSQPGIVYISMANNGNVNDVRKLMEQARLSSTLKKQVFILDEVHRLSKEAFDALLIPLESNSMKTLFILCSTEPEKIPGTVKSRVQMRHFKPVPLTQVAKHLLKISEKEGLQVSTEEIKECARDSKGSMRDAIRNLENYASSSKTKPFVNYRNKLLISIAKKEIVNAYQLTQEMESNGEDFAKTAENLYRDLTDLLLMLNGVKIPHFTDSHLKIAKVMNERIDNCIQILGDIIQTMNSNNIDKKILFDIAISRMMK